MATFDIETAACDFTEELWEQLGEKGVIKDVDYPTRDNTSLIRLWDSSAESTWVEVLVTEDQVKGILVEGDGEFRTPAEWTETAELVRQIQELWEQFLK